jgi:actin related protein 2/3 complex subunit 1A/1B
MGDGKVAPAVSYHAFSKDLQLCAVAPNSEDVHIFGTKGSDDVAKWDKKYTLKEHGGFVSGIDWSPVTNLIVTCGHDRNAYVWRYDEKQDVWKPTLVILRINRAATGVKWSPAGNKFAVTSGAKCVPVCHYEQANDWWISKMIKKHKSTVLSLAWCCNNKFVVTGGCDFKCRIFSAYMAGIDNAEDDGFGEIWKDQHKFGEILAEFDMAQSWVQAVAWSPNGFRISFAEHASRVHFVQILAGSPPIVESKNHKGLPFSSVGFLTDNTICAVGWDNNPALFTVVGGSEAEPKWGFQENFDKASKAAETKAGAAPSKTASTAATTPTRGGAFAASRAMFAAATDRGHTLQSSSKVADDKKAASLTNAAPTVVTRHSNCITALWPVTSTEGVTTKVFTSGLDGRIVAWELDKLKIQIK